MKLFKIKTITLSVAIATSIIGVSAAGFTIDSQSRFGRKLEALHSGRQFHGQKPMTVNDLNTSDIREAKASRSAVDAPSKQYEDIAQFDYLEGPDGSTWYYTAEFDKTIIEHNEYWIEEIINGYTFTIYDELFKEVGKITDRVKTRPGETRAASVTLDPAVTVNFFNTDDNIELMVYVGMNTETFHNNYYYKIYSLDGEKDADGYDEAFMTIEGRCVDAVNVPDADGNENFYITFAEDVEPNVSDFDDFVDYVNAFANRLIVYSKATDETGPRVISQKDIFLSNIPGDTTDGIYMITKPVDGTLYIIYSYYEKPYFVDPTGFAQDESATEDNSLVIETYKTTGSTPELVSTTKIPVEIEQVDNQLCYTFYSIGSVAWKDDVDMSVNGTQNAPAFVVARDWCKAATLEDVLSSYDIYGSDGKLIRNLATNTESISILSPLPGKEPQCLFITLDDNGQYIYSFVDLHSGKTQFTLEADNDGDVISSACDRVLKADGSMKYAFEMKYYGMDADDNYYSRVAWFNSDGTLDHIDSINIGKDVMASMVNMASYVLQPDMFDDDDAMEYAVLIKHTVGDNETTRNEFIVVDDDGKRFVHFTEDDGKGQPYTFTVVPGKEGHKVMMIYTDDYTSYNIDLYDLPFLNAADETGSVEDVIANGTSNLRYDGETVTATGSDITVYDTTGKKRTEGHDSVSVKAFEKGVYVVVAVDAYGNKTTVKIVR